MADKIIIVVCVNFLISKDGGEILELLVNSCKAIIF